MRTVKCFVIYIYMRSLAIDRLLQYYSGMNNPIPPKRNSYPFHSWAVDEYQAFTFTDRESLRKCRAAAHVLGCRLGKKFVTKITQPLTLQVWRIK